MQRLAIVLAAASVAAGTVTARGRQDAPQAPTFRSAVDLVPVDVSIIDKSGRPVSGLEAGDFVLTIDGRPRKIATAQYIAAGDAEPPAPARTYYSSNAAAAGGRLIMLVVDQGNIGPGRGKLALDAASRFISRLGPADRIGVVGLPGAGPHIEFTSNRALIQSLLPQLIGHAEQEGMMRVGLAEALNVERGDPVAMAEILDRECAGVRVAAEMEECARRLAIEAAMVRQEARVRTQTSLLALRALIERLAATPTPKTLVLISEGMVLEQQLADVSWLGPAAARGQIVLYVLQLATPPSDAGAGRTSPTRGQDLALGEEGLSLIAGLARGSLIRVVGGADNAFSRLALEMSGYYLLSFEPEPQDRDGTTHKIRIDVPGRPGIQVRSRSQFTVDPPRTATDQASLAETLRSPLLATDIGLQLSTYTLQDAATGRPRILIAAEIDRSATSSGGLAIAYTVVDDRGRVIASQIEKDVTAPVREPAKIQTYVGSVLAEEPGVHTVKLAVVDGRGKRGSVERTFRAQTSSAGQIRVTDLVLAENIGTRENRRLVPAVAGDFTSGTLGGYLELYSDAEEVLQNASVVLDVAESETGRALDSAVAAIRRAEQDPPNRRTAEAGVTIALLPPGEYVARAVISINGRKAGTVTRAFRIARTATSIAAPESRALTGTRPAIAVPLRTDTFDRATVLSPQVVGFFLDRVNVGPAGRAAAPAIEQARAGQFDAAAAAVPNTDGTQLAAVFLSGLALYSNGQLEAAAGKFREALRLDSEFFPAAFYLGSCYAAGGRDREAVGAWQTSLVTESDAPFIYTLLGDALLRLRDPAQAIDILKEASALWPEDEQVRLRLAAAHGMAGQGPEALAILEPYLSAHPADHEQHFVALRILYETRAAGRQVRSPAEDRALFTRLAAAYSAAGGPQQALVEQWRKFMEKP